MQSIKEIFKVGYGPSSSHTIGPSRAAKFFLENNPDAEKIIVTLYGSLAATGKGHHTDLAIKKILQNKVVEIVWNDDEELPFHPNGMNFTALIKNEIIDTWDVYSVGGGDLVDDKKRLPETPDIYSIKNMNDVLDWCHNNGRHMWELVELVEGKEIWTFLAEIWKIMQNTIQNGLENEGVLPGPLNVSRKAASYYTKAKITKTSKNR